MLPAQYRLTLRSHQEFFQRSQIQDSPSFRMYWSPSDNQGGLAVVVPKRVSLLSTVRNQIKRSLVKYFERNLDVLSQKNVVIVAKPYIKRKSEQEIHNELAFLLPTTSL